MSKFYCDSSTGWIYEVVVVTRGAVVPDGDAMSEVHDVDLPPSSSYWVSTRLLGATREQARLNALEDLKSVLEMRRRHRNELEKEITHLEALIKTPIGDT